ncbi:MAG: AMP-binding protein [Adhaeribacter sp.]
MKPDSLQLNGKKFYYEEIAQYSFRDSIPVNGYEAKVLEFCRNWLNGQQEFLLHTSGSTGTPKAIVLYRQQLEASARRTLAAFHLKAGDRALVCLNVEAVSGLMMLVRGLVGELALTVIEPIANPLAFSKPAPPYDFLSLVPYQLATILQETPQHRQTLNQAKVLLLGGAPVEAGLAAEIRKLEVPVYLSYGMTETASHIALRRLNGAQPEPWFSAFPGVKLGQDDRGCLTISADVTDFQTVVTNDLVKLQGPNHFEWLGRADNTINTGGHKVQLEKVEVMLAQCLVERQLEGRFFVAAEKDPKLGSRLVAVLEGENLDPETETALKADLACLLPKYERPKAWYYAARFAATASGKIDKQATLQQIHRKRT